jgi:predicted permease
VHVDGRVLLAALGAAAITGLLFGLVPALTLAESGPATLLRAGRTAQGSGRLQRTMIAVELALSMVLLVGAGLLARSLHQLSSIDPGFRTANLLAVDLSAQGRYWEDSTRVRAFYDQLVPQLRAIPGVTGATLTTSPPFSGRASSSPYLLPGEGAAERTAHTHEVEQRTILPNYFALTGIPLVAGRAFSIDDRTGGPLVAIISMAAARRDFPIGSALGRQVMYQGKWRTIIGVASDVKSNSLSGDARPSIYTPMSQRVDLPAVLLRTRGDASAIGAAVRRTVREIDPTFFPGDVTMMDDLVRRSFSEERFRTALIVLFGAMALVLAAVGMYGVTARAVGRRTREVGIRVAVGAPTRSIVAMLVNQTLAGVALGVAAGTILALAASRVLAPYLFGITTHDPITYSAILGFLAAVSIVASWLPARRASRIEPAIVLRSE